MTDYSELTLLAEAATGGRWVTDGEYVNEHGNVTYAYVAREDGGRIAEALANCLVKTDEQCRANAAYIAAANPAAVLALIASLKHANEERDSYQRVGILAMEQRDQLKAENERLQQFEAAYKEWSDKTDWVQETVQGYELGMHRADVLHKRCRDGAFHQQAQADRIKVLMAEVEALRKDAERYRWFRVNSLQVISTARSWVHDLDTEVDTAMAEQAARWSRL